MGSIQAALGAAAATGGLEKQSAFVRLRGNRNIATHTDENTDLVSRDFAVDGAAPLGGGTLPTGVLSALTTEELTEGTGTSDAAAVAADISSAALRGTKELEGAGTASDVSI